MRANSSLNPNRPPSAQRNWSNESARRSWGSGRGTPAGRVLSSDMNRPVGRASSASWTSSSSSRGGPLAGSASRRGTFSGFDRPPSARSTQENLSGRGNSYGSGGSYFNANHSRSNFGNSRFSSGNLTNASFSRSGSAQFGGSHSNGVEGNSFARNGFGHQGYGHGDFSHGGYGHGRGSYGYGRSGWYGGGGWHGGGWYGGGGYSGGNDFWFLGDLFGLALNFSSLALNPWAPVGLAGWNLLDTGIQALSSLDNNDQQSSYNPPLCGTYDSDENPGCMQ
jgi:hypothetical protein